MKGRVFKFLSSIYIYFIVYFIAHLIVCTCKMRVTNNKYYYYYYYYQTFSSEFPMWWSSLTCDHSGS